MKVYLEVTRDKYELPLLVCDTISELSKRSGVRRDVISRQLSQNRTGNVVKDRSSLHWFREVEIDLEDNYDDLMEVTDEEIQAHTIDNINRDYAEYIKQGCRI